MLAEEIKGARADQGLQGLPPLSPLEIFNKHAIGQPQSSVSHLHAHQITSTPDRERHESASTDRESEIRRIFDQGMTPSQITLQNSSNHYPYAI